MFLAKELGYRHPAPMLRALTATQLRDWEIWYNVSPLAQIGLGIGGWGLGTGGSGSAAPAQSTAQQKAQFNLAKASFGKRKPRNP